MDINKLIKKNWRLSYAELAKLTGLSDDAVRKRYRRLNLPHKREFIEDEEIKRDLELARIRDDKGKVDKKYRYLLGQIEKIEKERDAVVELSNNRSTYQILATKNKEGEATAVILASDWHAEERVDPLKVSSMNKYNLEVAKKRADEFFVNAVKLLKGEQSRVKVNNMVLALLGDFISGNIHEELLANCELPPVKAMVEVQNWIASGIEYILRETEVNLVIPCHVGNHTRITKKIHLSNEQGNSLEYYMYHTLADRFRNEKRITWVIAEGYHSYVSVYDKTLRFHHGHAMQYGGGVGGLYIPVNKAIAQWNKIRWADIDCFGHFHTQRNGGNFLSNGSLIGYNAFALSIKCDYEPPKQQFFLIDSNRGLTVNAPILFSV